MGQRYYYFVSNDPLCRANGTDGSLMSNVSFC